MRDGTADRWQRQWRTWRWVRGSGVDAEQPRTVVLVTHDIEEAAQLADRVLVLSERPARVRDEVHLALPRPRDLTHPTVLAAVHRILTTLGLERDETTAQVELR